MIGEGHHPHIPRRSKARDRLRRERPQREEAFVFGGEGGHSGLLRPFRAGDSFFGGVTQGVALGCHGTPRWG